ncbi:hypothetical protein A2Z33_07140 [Candidatus Gottesmanbacteria bacterium RBG_16_52_11]|uniref:AI-2E family transporter n=1 Tax=Candidatus Gottesmanbacteria bacterium RBG_16_52_11 TaxID=1798374 RepID=A0A1F5YXV6_9BACT|nr:MAG: hypothetical protein A2Z33_07140 [Candidatus Gottesmanbacteria bacterium RBG_16_52_11]
MVSKIEISHRTIIFVVLLLAALWLVLEIRDILFLLFISFIVMSALRPYVEYLERFRIPRALSILFIYIVLFGIVGAAVSSLVPTLVAQTTRFIVNLPNVISRINPDFVFDLRSFTSQLTPIGENLVRVTVNIFSNIFALLTVLVFSFYMLLERRHLTQYLEQVIPDELTGRSVKAVESVEDSLGAWLRGELVLMLSIGTLTYIGLSFLSVEFALPLAIIAGLLEIVPVIGPIVSAVPAVLVAFAVSPFLALATAALYFLIQQVENNIIVPVVMKRAVGISPLITILALLIGSRLAGITGAVLAVPIVVTLRAILRSIYGKDN